MPAIPVNGTFNAIELQFVNKPACNRSQFFLKTRPATSIPATLLDGGVTAHSQFKIPVQLEADALQPFGGLSHLANLLRTASTILWDEAPMSHRHCFEKLIMERGRVCKLTTNHRVERLRELAPARAAMYTIGHGTCSMLAMVLIAPVLAA